MRPRHLRKQAPVHSSTVLVSAGLESAAAEKARCLTELFGFPAAVCVGSDEMGLSPGPLEEEVAIVNAVERRRREFRAGRICARSALQYLGAEPVVLPPMADRRPRWPAGYVGSISHCTGCVAAVVARASDTASLGLDIELRGGLTEDLLSRVAHPIERAVVSTFTGWSPSETGTLVFSAKEAFYKAYFPLAKKFLDFTEARLNFFQSTDDPMRGTFYLDWIAPGLPTSAAIDRLRGFWWCDLVHVHCGVWA